ncbi:MAG: hypothetical protein GY778_15175 [bacterium]|nr:hypothetical protein [bacterium]
MVGLDRSLPELCDVGVSSDERAWARSLVRLRREIEGERRSPSEAGLLAALLTLAGRRNRGLDVLRILEEVSASARIEEIVGVVPSQRNGGRCWAALGSGDSDVYQLGEEDMGMDLLAALVLSGRWKQARRCCEGLSPPAKHNAG